MGELPPLSLADWIVLTVVDEQPTHGFAIVAFPSRRHRAPPALGQNPAGPEAVTLTERQLSVLPDSTARY
ncbi:hypothetical protein GCM10010399_84560 [Dactylosporangium fulvum]|uniref:Uncharacterized protein n=1 Tax=Dactylosporangium fulvum TaxID=53359 RepID=A0ABY5VSB8_9ACTN|nr:hypothetical protein [Dactylosporangium fulvum]UWP79984.1 hypothetical protein Dfulv_33120 [Dactylosporangium fulvum]